MFSVKQFFGKHLLLVLLTIALGGVISIAFVPQIHDPVTDYIGDNFGPKADSNSMIIVNVSPNEVYPGDIITVTVSNQFHVEDRYDLGYPFGISNINRCAVKSLRLSLPIKSDDITRSGMTPNNYPNPIKIDENFWAYICPGDTVWCGSASLPIWYTQDRFYGAKVNEGLKTGFYTAKSPPINPCQCLSDDKCGTKDNNNFCTRTVSASVDTFSYNCKAYIDPSLRGSTGGSASYKVYTHLLKLNPEKTNAKINSDIVKVTIDTKYIDNNSLEIYSPNGNGYLSKDGTNFSQYSETNTLKLGNNIVDDKITFYVKNDKAEKVIFVAKANDKLTPPVSRKSDTYSINFIEGPKPTIETLSYQKYDKNNKSYSDLITFNDQDTKLADTKFSADDRINFKTSFDKISIDQDDLTAELPLPLNQNQDKQPQLSFIKLTKDENNTRFNYDNVNNKLIWNYTGENKLIKDQIVDEEFQLQIADNLDFGSNDQIIKLASQIVDPSETDSSKWQKSNEIQLTIKSELTLSPKWETIDESTLVDYDNFQEMLASNQKNNVPLGFFTKIFSPKSALAEDNPSQTQTTTNNTQSDDSIYSLDPSEQGILTLNVTNSTNIPIKDKDIKINLKSKYFTDLSSENISVKQLSPEKNDNYPIKDKKLEVNKDGLSIKLSFDEFPAKSSFEIVIKNIKMQVRFTDVEKAFKGFNNEQLKNLQSQLDVYNKITTDWINENYKIENQNYISYENDSFENDLAYKQENTNYDLWQNILGKSKTLFGKLNLLGLFQLPQANASEGDARTLFIPIYQNLKEAVRIQTIVDMPNEQIFSFFDQISNQLNSSPNFSSSADDSYYRKLTSAGKRLLDELKDCLNKNKDVSSSVLKNFNDTTGMTIDLPPFQLDSLSLPSMSRAKIQYNDTNEFVKETIKDPANAKKTQQSIKLFESVPAKYYAAKKDRYIVNNVIEYYKLVSGSTTQNIKLAKVSQLPSSLSNGNTRSQLGNNIKDSANQTINRIFANQISAKKDDALLTLTNFKSQADQTINNHLDVDKTIKSELDKLAVNKNKDGMINAKDVNSAIYDLINSNIKLLGKDLETATSNYENNMYINSSSVASLPLMTFVRYKEDDKNIIAINNYFSNLSNKLVAGTNEKKDSLRKMLTNFNNDYQTAFSKTIIENSLLALSKNFLAIEFNEEDSSQDNQQAKNKIINIAQAEETDDPSSEIQKIFIEYNNTVFLPPYISSHDSKVLQQKVEIEVNQYTSSSDLYSSKHSFKEIFGVLKNSNKKKITIPIKKGFDTQSFEFDVENFINDFEISLEEDGKVTTKDSLNTINPLPQPELSISSIIRDSVEENYADGQPLQVGDILKIKMNYNGEYDLENITAGIEIPEEVKGVEGQKSQSLANFKKGEEIEFTLTLSNNLILPLNTEDMTESNQFNFTPILSYENSRQTGNPILISLYETPASVNIGPDTIIRKNDKGDEEDFVYIDGADNELYPGDRLNLTINADYIGNNIELKVDLPDGVSTIDGSKEAVWNYDQMIGEKTEELQLKLDDSIPLDVKQLKFKAHLVQKNPSGNKNLATSDLLAVDLWQWVKGNVRGPWHELPSAYINILDKDGNEIDHNYEYTDENNQRQTRDFTLTKENGDFTIKLNRNKDLDKLNKVKFVIKPCYYSSNNIKDGKYIICIYPNLWINEKSADIDRDKPLALESEYGIDIQKLNSNINLIIDKNNKTWYKINGYQAGLEIYYNLYHAIKKTNEIINQDELLKSKVKIDNLNVNFGFDNNDDNTNEEDYTMDASYSDSTIVLGGSGMGALKNEFRNPDVELHEFGHYFMDKLILCDRGNKSLVTMNHIGFINPTTTDSMQEGLASFYAIYLKNQIYKDLPNKFTYMYPYETGEENKQNTQLALPANNGVVISGINEILPPPYNDALFYNKSNGKVGGSLYEEEAVSALLWSLLYGKQGEYKLKWLPDITRIDYQSTYSILDLIKFIDALDNKPTVNNLYNKLKENSKSITNTNELNNLFLMHGFALVNSDWETLRTKPYKSTMDGKNYESIAFTGNIEGIKINADIVGPLRIIKSFFLESRLNREFPEINKKALIKFSKDIKNVNVYVLYDQNYEYLNQNYQVTPDENGNVYLYPNSPLQFDKLFITADNTEDYAKFEKPYVDLIHSNIIEKPIINFKTKDNATSPSLKQMQAMEAEKKKIKQDDIDKALAEKRAQEEADRLQKEKEEQEKSLAQQKEAEEKAKIQAEIDRLNKEKAEADERARQAEEARLKALEDLKIAQQKELEAQQAQLKAEQEKAAQLARLEAEKQAEIERNQKLAQENAKLQAKLASYEKQINDFESQLTKTQQDLADARKKKGDILNENNNLLIELSKAKEDNQVLRQISLNLRRSALSLEEQLKNLNIAYIIQNESRIQQQLDNLQEKKDLIELTDINTEIKNQLKDQLSLNSDLTQQNTDLLNQLENQQDIIIKVPITINKLQSDLADTQDNLDKIQFQKADLEKQNADISVKLQQAKDDHNAISQINLTLQKTVNDFQLKLKEAQLAQAQKDEELRLEKLKNQILEEENHQKALADLKLQQQLKAKELELQSNQTDEQVSVEQDKQTILNDESHKKIDKLDEDIKKVDNEKQQITNKINQAVENTPVISNLDIKQDDPTKSIKQTQRQDLKIEIIENKQEHTAGLTTQTEFKEIPEVSATNDNNTVQLTIANLDNSFPVTVSIYKNNEKTELFKTPIVSSEATFNVSIPKNANLGTQKLIIDNGFNQATTDIKVTENRWINLENFKLSLATVAMIILFGLTSLKFSLFKPL